MLNSIQNTQKVCAGFEPRKMTLLKDIICVNFPSRLHAFIHHNKNSFIDLIIILAIYCGSGRYDMI